MTDKDIGLQIKKARAEKGMSQEDLAKEIGVTWEMISRYENGRSSAHRHLDKFGMVLGKPISYFWGVSENTTTISVESIVKALKKEGLSQGAGKSNEVTLVDDLSILGFDKSIKLSRKYYSAPDWIVEKYNDIFALRLDSVDEEGIGINKGDIGYFSVKAEPKSGDMVLVESGMNYSVQKYSEKISSKIKAVLIAQERRFR